MGGGGGAISISPVTQVALGNLLPFRFFLAWHLFSADPDRDVLLGQLLDRQDRRALQSIFGLVAWLLNKVVSH